MPENEVRFFTTPAEWRLWLARHHTKEPHVWVGFHKTKTGKPSITWPQSVDEALCFGWIDGVRKSIDDEAYKIRFTPRKATSIWSSVNIGRVAELTKLGRMEPAGLAAFAKRKESKSGVYSFERKEEAKLEPVLHERFEKNKKAWTWFQAQAPWYRRTALHWVVSAKKEETRLRRFEQLLSDSASEQKLGHLMWNVADRAKVARASKKSESTAKKVAPASTKKKSAAKKSAAKKSAAKKSSTASRLARDSRVQR